VCSSDLVKALDAPDAVVVHVLVKAAEAEAAPEAAAPGAAEPEVITRKKAEDEGEE